jgi:hypothetical protein
MEPRTATNNLDDDIAAHFQAAPGTEILFDKDGEHGATSKQLKNLQHLKHGDSHILLIPQPSLNDPNDPLRWSTVKKWGTFLNACWYAFNGSITGPIMAAGKHLPLLLLSPSAL